MKPSATAIMRTFGLAALVIGCLILPACGGGGGGGNGGDGPDDPVPPTVRIVISPTSALLRPGDTQQFNATVSNATNTAVTWSVDDIEGGNATVGEISDDGLYTAPDAVPTSDTVTVTATSEQDTSRSASATISIVELGSGVNNALLNGRYAFEFAGSQNVGGVFVAGGTFVADGAGRIRNGREDGNFAGGLFAQQPFNGVYSIGEDRRGTMVIANTAGADCGCAPRRFTFKFNVVSNRLAHFIEFDDTGPGKGTIEKQDTSAFSLQALDGSFALLLDGLDFQGRLSIAGRFSSEGGSLSQAIADINNSHTVRTAEDISGGLTLGENGRGEATIKTPLGHLHFAYYIVSSDKLLFVGMDVFPVLSGTAIRQTSSAFSNASLFGKYIFGMTASTLPLPQTMSRADAGLFDADGVSLISDGVLDRNSAAGVLLGSSLSGTFDVAENGRGTAALDTEAGAENVVFYLASESEGFILQTDVSVTGVNNVASGHLWRQEANVFSAASWEGQYGLFLTGSDDSTDPTNISGSLHSDGAGSLTTMQDIDAGSLLPDQNMDGSYDVEISGQGTAAFPNSEFNIYLISGTDVVFIGTDAGEVLFGTALKHE